VLQFFCFVATAAYAVDTALQIIDIRKKFMASRGPAGDPLPVATSEPLAQGR